MEFTEGSLDEHVSLTHCMAHDVHDSWSFFIFHFLFFHVFHFFHIFIFYFFNDYEYYYYSNTMAKLLRFLPPLISSFLNLVVQIRLRLGFSRKTQSWYNIRLVNFCLYREYPSDSMMFVRRWSSRYREFMTQGAGNTRNRDGKRSESRGSCKFVRPRKFVVLRNISPRWDGDGT